MKHNIFLSSLILFSVFSTAFLLKPELVLAASSPYDVESSVRNGWNSLPGGKNHSQRSGRKLVYDVYASKYTSGGYKIVNKNFGKGTQPYINFQGWAVIQGYKRHTSTNHETYIVAEKVAGDSGIGTKKVYGTLPINISGTEDLEYNNRGSGVYNECWSGATYKDNQLDCNMRYDNVGFNAYLPFNELFPTNREDAKWVLYIVKRVESRIVYERLILPFNFTGLAHKGGTIDLESGVNANYLRMIGTDVIRRTYPRQKTSGSVYGYFNTGSIYTRTNQEESKTAVWYAVRSHHDGNATRWAPSAYWKFGGEQAVLDYNPPPDNAPPVHISHELINSRYQNGNDYWSQPNDQVYIRLRQRDPDSGNKYQYLRLNGNGQDIRSMHSFHLASTYNEHFLTSPHAVINSAQREEHSSYGRVKWGVVPKTHNHSYDVMYYYKDNDNNHVGYNDTGMNLRVDGVVPQHNSQGIYNYRYKNGNDYWVRPNDKPYVQLRQYDPHSGNRHQYIRFSGSGQDARSQHDFSYGATHNNHWMKSSHVVINSAERKENSYYGMVKWTFTPKTHGHYYNVLYYYRDNVDNNSGDYNDTSYNVRVDGVSPSNLIESISNHRYRNGNNYWIRPNDTVNIKLRSKDDDSGLKQTELSSGSGSDRTVARHVWSGSSTNNQIVTDTTNAFSIVSANRTYNSGSTKEVTFGLRGHTHGASHIIRHRDVDNVDNISSGDAYGWSYAQKTVHVDGVRPNIYFRNSTDTSNYFSRNWSTNPITVRLKFDDGSGSGYKHSRYAWTKSTSTPSSWSSWTTSSNYTTSKSSYGAWYLHVQGQDHVGNTYTTYKGPYRFNDAPVADFTANPNPTDRLTSVTFTNKSSDPNGNSLTYDWKIRKKGSSSWTNLSTTKNPSHKFTSVGTWEVRLEARDTHGETHARIREVIVNNLGPKAGYNTDKNKYYIGDVIQITSTASDPENDPLTYSYLITEPNGNKVTKTTKDFSHHLTQVGNYTIKQTVTDSHGASDSVTKIIPVNQLVITGRVLHTPKWKDIQTDKGNSPEQFYSGEIFVLEADVTNYTIDKVEVKFNGVQTNGNSYTKTVALNRASGVLYDGQLHDAVFTKNGTTLQNGIHSFTFTAYYSNGTVRTDNVQIEIIGTTYDAFKFHRKR